MSANRPAAGTLTAGLSAGAERLAFWREMLRGAPPTLELPFDRPRPARLRPAGGRVEFALDAATAGALRLAASRADVPPRAVLLATFAALLARLSAQSDVVVGTPGAADAGLLPLRLTWRSEAGLDELAARVARALGAAERQPLPARDDLLAALGLSASRGRAPFTQTALCLDAPLPRSEPRLDLSLSLSTRGEGYVGQLDYASDLFDPPSARRVLGHWLTLLAGALQQPRRPLSHLPLLDAEQRRAALRDCEAPAPADGDISLHELFAAQARATPAAPAVMLGAQVLSYAELQARALELAQRLARRGARPGTAIALAVERSFDLPVAVLGVLATGAAYVPLDPAYPRERLAFMLDNAAAPVLVTRRRWLARLPVERAQVLLLDDAASDGHAAESGAGISLPAARPDDLAYVIYTSGSTGQPKGVALPQRALANLVRWQRALLGDAGAARTAQFASLSFDVSCQELFTTWASGGALVLVGEDARRDPRALLRLLSDAAVTRLFLPFVALQQLAEEACQEGRFPAALREVITAGEQLQVTPQVVRFFEGLPRASLHNHYGPSETHVATAHTLGGPPATWPALPPIGRPIAGARACVLDARGEPQPPGVAGELLLGGAGLARGYIGRPDLTAERFVPDPFALEAGARLYRTGDLARRRPDGTLEFLGRADQQVKVRGFRVEPGEVEAVLQGHPGVREAAVALRDTPAGPGLVGYVVPQTPPGPTTAELRGFLLERLAEYLVPGAFVTLESLPLTASGKLDRRALPAPQRGSVAAGAAPRTPVETALASLWREILGAHAVGLQDDFFALGGHSLLATLLVARLRRLFDVEVTPTDVFEAPSLGALAARVEAALRAGAAPPAAIPRAPRDRPLPLSFAQQRLWFLEALRPGQATYNVPYELTLRGALDLDALRAALAAVIARHEALRTTFAQVDGPACQIVEPAGPLAMPLEDLSAAPLAARAEARERLAQAEARAPFDLARGPLLRARLLRLEAAEHVLLLTLHHIAFDGWSAGVLLRELGDLYAAARAGRSAELPALPLQYADYACWQRQRADGEWLDAQLDHWRARLGGAAPLELPTDHARPALPSLAGARDERLLPGGAWQRAQGLARRAGVTPFMLLLAAFSALLARICGQDDVVLGTPVAGRTHPELADLIGFFVNTLALRTDLSGDPTVAQLLARVKSETLQAYRHQELPFERLVEALHPERDPGRNPLFQVAFAAQDMPLAALRLPELEVDAREGPSGSAKFDLLLVTEEGADGLRLTFEYARDLFEPARVARWARQFVTLLTALAEADADDTRLSALSLLDEDERRTVILEWNQTARAYPRDASLAEIFDEQVRAWPHAPAAVCAGETLTYAELDARASALASALQARGVEPEVVVGLCASRSLDLLVGLVGIVKAGAAYLPLDPSWPRERLEWLLDDARAALVVTQPQHAGALPAACPVIELGAPSQVQGWVRRPQRTPRPENLAYVTYTSGTTGRPKGVRIPQRAVVRLVKHCDYVRLERDCALLMFAPLAFDASTFEIWGALLNGGRVVLVPAGQTSLEELGATIREQGVTTAFLTTGLFNQMVAERLGDLVGLRDLLTGGEVMSPVAARQALAGLPQTRLTNGYGPTENTTFTTCWTLSGTPEAGLALPIGRPIANTRVYVLDGRLEPAAIGMVGELYVGGDGVARDYLGRPESSAASFVPDPWGEPGARLYRTGDFARWREDGALDFLGRRDAQIKLRGHRIEPGEIESAVLAQTEVSACAVVLREDRPGDPRLVAYIVPRAGATLDLRELRARLRATLPEFMLPSAWVALDVLPLTAHGKLDRRALPAPEVELEAVDAKAPTTPLEELLAGIWCELLGLPRVGLSQDFFELGGHSLLATQVVSRLRQALHVELPLRALFEAPTVAGLAQRVALLRAEPGALPAPVRAPRAGPAPLSFAQQRLWFFDQLLPGVPLYNVPLALRLEGPLDVPALRAALDALQSRHEALRTRFALLEGEPRQWVGDPAPVVLEACDLSAWGEEADAEALRQVESEARRPFDLSRAAWRVALLRQAAERHTLLLTLHHIVCDGWTLDLLVGELATAYQAALSGASAELPAAPWQYVDYAAWQRQVLLGAALDPPLAYWRRVLGGPLPALDLPADRPRPALESFDGARLDVLWPPSLLAALRRRARREQATLFMLLLAGFEALLQRLSGQTDMLVGTPIAGRTHAEWEGVCGLFVNTLVLRTDLSGDPTFGELVARVREVTLAAYAHQQVPFERLVESLRPTRDLSRNPLFQVLFVLRSAPFGALRLPGVRVQILEPDTGTSKFDLTLACEERPDGLLASLEYATDLFERARIERLADCLRVLFEAVAEAPEAGRRAERLSELPLLDAAARRAVLALGAGERLAPRVPGGLHELFELQARRTPQATALVHGHDAWSYERLERRANRIARRLRALGVGAETRVGVCTRRTPQLVAGLLGVLKAGAAYVPLDPAYPSERVAFMLRDSGARVVLAEGGLPAGLAGATLEVVDLQDPLAAESDTALGLAVAPQGLAYVIYTSGSTGRPKGVAIEHRSASTFAHWARGVFGDDELRGVLAGTSICFDLSVFEIFVTLAWGGTVLLARDALELPELPRRDLLTLVNSVPSAMAELARLGALPPGVRTVNLAGEPLKGELVERVYACAAVQRVLNLYGPSEDTTYSTFTSVARGTSAPTIGRPLAETQAYLLDARGDLVPLGVPGELYLGGAGLARGYLGRPELTAERFVPDPFGARSGARLYRTGDLARWRADGELDFLGRIDHQVKVRGFRIELGEIEAALLAQPGVAAAVVVARDDAAGEIRLVAYVTARDGQRLDERELRLALKARLPAPMLPAAIVALEALPLTPNGKVDRGALPAPAASRSARAPDASQRAPTPAEEVVAAVWADVLGIARVGVGQDFFELGGHSLNATQAVMRLRAALGVELPLRALFEHPTVAALAAHALALRAHGAGPAAPLELRPRGGALPASSAQQRLWFFDQLLPGSCLYNVPYALWLDGALDGAALRGALQGLVARHEALRTTFVAVGGKPQQVVASEAPLELREVDLQAYPADEREPAARRLADDEARRPFDLARGPLVRASLLRLGPQRHVLLLTLHHVICDGWSAGVLVREWGVLYAAFARGHAPELPALPVQYADYAAWQQAEARREALAAPLDWWRARLAQAPTLELPADRARPAQLSIHGAREERRLSRATSSALDACARRLGATPFMVLLAAFEVLLQRLGGQDEVVVGVPVAGRARPELEGVVGFFVNTLPLRGDLSGDPTCAALVTRVREELLLLHEHQDVPFERLVEELQPQREPGRHPFFQVLAVWRPEPWPAFESAGLRVQAQEIETDSAKFDLTLACEEGADGLRLTFEYARDLFEPARVARWARQIVTLLTALAGAEADDTRLSALSLLDEDERRTVILEWNQTAHAYARDASLAEIFDEQVRAWPHALAAVCAGETLTYAELDARASALASALQARGVEPDVVVGLCASRSLDLLVGLVGIVKAGGAYLPLDPSWPRERLQWLLDDARAALVVTQPQHAGALPAACPVIELGAPSEVQGGVRRSQRTPRPENLAYVTYTSGTTGRPKGVRIPQRAVVRLVKHCDYVRLERDCALLMFAPLAFDASTFEIWGALLNGGRVVIVPAGQTSLEELGATIREQGVTTAFLTTGLFNQMVAERPGDLAGLRDLLTGGEVMSPVAARQALAVLPQTRLTNAYGPTENTTFTTCWTLSKTPEAGLALPIGRPIANTRVYVLDGRLEPAAIGMVGELYVGGDGVARDYLGRPESSAASFVPDPWGEPGARLYRTGDFARWSEDGALDFLGRRDAQIKLRGHRIEPGEIESAVLAQTEVSACAVVLREDRPGDPRLVAYVVPRAGATRDLRELRARLRTALPEFMLPSAWVALDVLPLTAHGKLDRRALPAPEHEPAAPDTRQPTPLETLLATVWAELLGRPRVGLEQDFFELGGHSLLATQVVSRLRQALHVELPLRALFEAPTVAGLAQRVAALRAEHASLGPLVPARRAPAELLPLSFAQQRLWFFDQLVPGSAAYNVPYPLLLEGPLDGRALEAALREIVWRHEALRTTFVAAWGQPRQVLGDEAVFTLRRVESDDAAQTRRLAEAEAREPFDLARGPLLRATLVREAAERHVLLLTLHHVVCDGWSLGVLARELQELYAAGVEGRPAELPELPLQYADFAQWQQAWLSGSELRAQLDFWRERVRGLTPLELPTDRPRPPVESFRGAICEFALPAALDEQVARFGRALGATPFMVLLAAFVALVQRYTGRTDVAVGTPIAGRNRSELEGLIGFFVNTLVLRSDLRGDPSFTELLGRVRAATLAAYAHQDVPFERLVEELHPQRDLGRGALFQVLFVFQSAPLRTPRLPGLRVEPFALHTGTSKFDLTLSLEPGAEGLRGTFEYATDLFDRERIERLARHFAGLLSAALAAPQERLSELPLLDADERRASRLRYAEVIAASAAVAQRVAAAVAGWRVAPQADELEACVLDAHGNALPEGVPGELSFMGRGLAGAACGEATTTALCLLPDAQGLEPGARLWRSGLPAQWRPGRLELVVPPPAAPPPARRGDTGAGMVQGLGRTPVEQALAQAFATALGRESVGLHDDFFELGGHSLLATRVVARARDALRVELPLRALFEAPTVASLARRVAALRADAPEAPAEVIPRVARDGPLPASFAQQRLWFFDQLHPGSALYLVPLPLRLDGPLDARALEAALRALVARHEALRTTFVSLEGRPHQLVAPELEIELPCVDLAELGAQAAEAEAQRRAEAEASRPFDLARGPLLRAMLLRLAPERHVLLLTLHHAVCDGWSLDVLMHELGLLYEACARGAASPLAPLPVQYADFSVWQRARSQGETLARQLAFWRERLGTPAPALRLPGARPAGSAADVAGATRSRALPAPLVETLRALARREGATLFMLTLAACQALLYELTGQTDIAIGTPVAGRGRSEVQGLIGFFVNTLVLRADLAARPTFVELLRRARETTLDAHAHQDVPFEKLVEELHPARDPAGTPFFQVMFGVQESPAAAGQWGPLCVTALDAGGTTAPFELSLWVFDGPRDEGAREAGLTIVAEYRSALFAPETIDGFLRRYQDVLERAAADPECRFEPEAARDAPVVPQAAREASSAAPAAGVEARRARLQERRARLSAEQRALLERRTAALGEPEPAAASCLVAIRPAGARPPLLCIHPAGGDVLAYAALARHLDAEQPLLAFQAPGLHDDHAPLTSIEALAERYVAELQTPGRRAPFHLCGWSLGGAVAFEMARRLVDQGHHVALLAVIDTVPGGAGLAPAEDAAASGDARWLLAIATYVEQLWGRALGLDEAALRGRAPEEQLQLFVARAQASGALQGEATLLHLRRLLAVFKANTRAWYAYRPLPGRTPITLIRAREQPEGPVRDAELAWAALAPALEAHVVPGDHVSLMAEPHVRELAATLEACLRRARGA